MTEDISLMTTQKQIVDFWDEIGSNPLRIMDELQKEANWLTEAKHFVAEPEFDAGLDAVAKIIASKGNVPQPAIASLCVKLQALSVVYRMRYNAFMSFNKGTPDANAIKNHYRSMYEGTDRLVDSLKYLMKNG